MKKARIIPFLLSIILLTGCWDNVELANTGFVISIAVDKYEKEQKEIKDSDSQSDASQEKEESNLEDRENKPEKEKDEEEKEDEDEEEKDHNEEDEKDEEKSTGKPRFTLTMEMPSDEIMINGASSKGEKIIKSVSASTTGRAMEMVNAYSSKEAYYGHTKIIIMGEALLKDKDLFSEAMDSLEQNREISQKVIILSSRGKGSEILTAEVTEETMAGFFMSDFYKKNNESIAYRQSLSSLVMDMENNNAFIIPEIEVTSDSLKTGGAAVMKDKELIAWLSDKELEAYLFVKAMGAGAVIETEYEGIFVPIETEKTKSKISFKDEGNLICTVDISVNANTGEYKFIGIDMKDNEVREEIERKTEEKIKKDIEDFIIKLNKEYKADVLEFTDKLKKKDYDLYLKYSDDWEKTIEHMEAHINVDLNLKESGTAK